MMLAWEKSKRRRGSCSGEMTDQWNKARQCIVTATVSVWRENYIPLPSCTKALRPEGGADVAGIPGATSVLYLLKCKWANIRSLWCWLCCPPTLTSEWNPDSHVIGGWRRAVAAQLYCVLFGLHKLMFPEQSSQLNYGGKPLCWQRWNPGRGNICREISACVDLFPCVIFSLTWTWTSE